MGLLQNMVIAVVEESVEGTLEADSATDVIKPLSDAKPPSLAVKLIENPEMSGDLSPEDPLIGPDDGSFEIPVALKGSGYSTTPPEADVLLHNTFGDRTIATGGTVDDTDTTPTTTTIEVSGANFAENDACLVDVSGTWEGAWITDVATGTYGQILTLAPPLSGAPADEAVVKPGVVYKPSSDEDDFDSMSVYYYMDGLRLKLAGCRGTVSFEFPWGEVPKAKFAMELMTWTPEDADIGYTPSYQDVNPFICAGGSFKMDTDETYIESLAVDLGLSIAKIGAIQSDGWYDTFISKREPSGSFDPFATSVAHFTAWKAMTAAALYLKIGDSTNMILVRLPRILRKDVKLSDKEGVNTYEIEFNAAKTSGDDEIFLAFLSSVDPS